jgi:alpha-L-arabinofuranosidase
VAARLGAARVQTTDSVYADGDWHHGALVLNRTEQTLRLYVDGEPATIEPTAGSCGTPASATALDVTACDTPADSANAFEVGRGFTGAVDEVEVVRFPLSATQIAKLAAANQLTVDATDLRTNTRSTEFGFMLEDISHSGDGGLYSELVRNRTFKEGWQAGEGSGPVPYWSLVQDGGATGSFAIDTSQPLNAAIDRSLRLHIDSLAPGGRLGAANGGYYGVAVRPSTRYTGSLWAKATPGFTGRLRVSLEKPDGTVLAGTAISGVGGDWARHTYALTTPAGIPTTTDNRIVVTAESPRGTLTGQDVWLSVVSLFPPTYKGHGLRTDIMEKLAAVHPGFFRIPGGNYLEGATVDTRFEFKQTLGPIWERPGHQNTAWGYWSTDGLGLLEYLRMAEDVGAQPLLAVFAGYTLNGRHVSEDDYGRYIQDALDEIEYAIGDTTTTWGARRAADGHPQPFNVHYVEIGNEDWFDQSGSYSWRFTRMYEAIKARYPQLKLIATTGGYQGGAASSTSSGTRPDVVDDHYYQSPAWFDANATRYDTASRSGPQVLVGEYGAIDGTPTGTLRAAVGEASFLTGLERNSDIVIGSTFAPLIVNEHAPNWPTNLIGIDAASSYGSPSYWVQRTFSANTGKTVIGSTLAGAGGLREVVTETRSGRNATFYVKLVNYGASRQTARITFQGVTRIDPTAVETVITGDPLARNTLDAPEAVVPATRDVTGLTTSSRFTLPGYSVTVLRVTGGV